MSQVIEAKQVGAMIRFEGRRVLKVGRRAAMRAAVFGKARLIKATDEKGITDLGQYKNSFEVGRGGPGVPATLTNISTIAGVIELGARPHPVSEAGVQSIREWVCRKMLQISADLGDQNEEVDRITFAIVKKLEREGQAGRYVFRDELDKLTEFLRREVERGLRGKVGSGWRKGGAGGGDA
jgi:hypothetical protein